MQLNCNNDEINLKILYIHVYKALFCLSSKTGSSVNDDQKWLT